MTELVGVRRRHEFERIVITGQVGPECLAFFDPGKAERVLLNLLFNAAEAVSAEDGRIVVSGECVADGVNLRVADNGPGIPDAIVSTLFKPFISHGKQKGTGLGLTVVNNVMQQHGGEAVVAQTGPGGTTFLLHFPAQPDGR